MMTIGSVAGTNNNMQAGYTGMNMQEDSVSKNIQNQIANAQKQLQELSSNENMTLEEKMKKRQEIQQEIATLNQQLRQHQIEQRKEQQKGISMDDMLGGSKQAVKTGNKGSGLSQASMTAIISADSSMKQAKTQGSMASQMEGRAKVLEAELQTDKGKAREKKEEELADLKEKVQKTTEGQMSTLANANEVMKEAAEADRTAEKAESKSGNEDKTGKTAEKAMKESNEAGKTGNESKKAGKTAEKAGNESGKAEGFAESPAGGSVNQENAAAPIGESVNAEVSAAKQVQTTLQAASYTPIDVSL